MTFEIFNPEALGRPRGWNNGMLAPAGGRVLFVAGQTGVEGIGAGQTGAGQIGTRQTGAGGDGGMAAQFGAALANAARVVEAAGGTVADVGRLTIYVTDMEAYRRSLAEVGAEYRAVFGKHFPAMALVAVTELVDPRAVVEIEATAVIGPVGDGRGAGEGEAAEATAAIPQALPEARQDIRETAEKGQP